MKNRQFQWIVASAFLFSACQTWTLPEQCSETLPTEITYTISNNTVICSAGAGTATWSLINSTGQLVKSNEVKEFTFDKNEYPSGNYTIKASGKTTCNFGFSLQKPYTNTNTFIDLIFVSSGTFVMGDALGEGLADEKPAHSVTISSFYMSKHEITQAQWTTIMGSNPSNFKDCSDCPVEQVSWDDVQVFLQKLNVRTGGKYRLPTEAEWVFAAGGGSGVRTRFGNGKDKLDAKEANFNAGVDYKTAYSEAGEYRAKTLPVGSFPPNRLGLYDMTGNVWEWCSDWYSSSLSNTSETNPTGPATGTERVRRGGGWNATPQQSRIMFRSGYNAPSIRSFFIGFRVVQ